jgi:hypothetical protein
MKRILIAAALVSVATPAFALCSYIGGTTICQDSGIYTETPNQRAYQPSRPQYGYEQPYSGRVDPNLPYGARRCHYGNCE